MFKKNDYFKIMGVCLVSLCLISGVGTLLIKQISTYGDIEGGLFDGYVSEKEEVALTLVTKEDLADEYLQRPVFSNNFLEEMEMQATILLASGKYSELDDWLSDAYFSYRESADQEISCVTAIENMRASLVIAKELESDYYAENMGVYMNSMTNDHVLASMMITIPCSVQLEILKHLDSLIFPPFQSTNESPLYLNKVHLTKDEELDLVFGYNAGRTEDYKFIGVSVFEVVAYERIWELTLGKQQDFTYTPISIFIKDEPPLYPITVNTLSPWESFVSTAQLDKLVRDNFILSLSEETAISEAYLEEALADL